MALLKETYREGRLPSGARMSLAWPGMIERVCDVRKKHSRTYTGYSIACAMVWAAILAVVWARAGDATRRTFALVFWGWAIGWLSATIARVVYPPPKRWEPPS
jgi:hypothetical protein